MISKRVWMFLLLGLFIIPSVISTGIKIIPPVCGNEKVEGWCNNVLTRDYYDCLSLGFNWSGEQCEAGDTKSCFDVIGSGWSGNIICNDCSWDTSSCHEDGCFAQLYDCNSNEQIASVGEIVNNLVKACPQVSCSDIIEYDEQEDYEDPQKMALASIEISVYRWLLNYREMILSAAAEFDVKPEYIAAVIITEESNDNGDLVRKALNIETIWDKVCLSKAQLNRGRSSAFEFVGMIHRSISPGNVHATFISEIIAIIMDKLYEGHSFWITTNMEVLDDSRVNKYNNNLKNLPQFQKFVSELDLYEADSFTTREDFDKKQIGIISASLSAMIVLWDLDPRSEGVSISDRPDILGTIYNVGFVNKKKKLFFKPKPNPQSGGVIGSIVVDGDVYLDKNFGDRTKLVAESENMRRYIAGEPLEMPGFKISHECLQVIIR